MLEQTPAARPEPSPDQESAAPWSRITFGPSADWPDADDAGNTSAKGASIPARDGDHTTCLRWERRIDADTGRSFHATALRLETALGVQHESQWSVELDARTDRLTLHWLRVVRNGHRIDHMKRECMRLLQRETQMERLVLSGRWTLLAVLDDVRVGDVIEAAFSQETAHPIRGRGREAFFAVPPMANIGAWRLTVRADEAAWTRLRWKSSPDAPVPEKGAADGRRWLTWQGSQTTPREPEPNTPPNALDHLWVQLSDLANWSELASAAAAAWARAGDETGIDDIAAFARPDTVDAAAILGLVTHLQENYRYLSLDLQAGGWVPSAPGAVARRRHGDCKDLAWLATTVLRRWSVSARPILVGSGFRERVAEMHPMALAFNHAILEVEWDGRRRWFDLTERGQGGDFDTRSVTWFGRGLPVDTRDNDLCAQPGARTPGVFALRENILVDTRPDSPSVVEQYVRVEGWQADHLRAQRAAQGAEFFAKERDEQAKRRYGNAKRVGDLQWRDDPGRNVCELAEAFEFTGAVQPGDSSAKATYQVPPCVPAIWFALPEEKPRRVAWGMPHPLEVRHRIELHNGERPQALPRRRRWEEAEFEATSEAFSLSGGWAWAYRFVVRAPEITADRLPVYRKCLTEFLAETSWRLSLPRGRARPRRATNFGELPATEKAATPPPPEAPAPKAEEVSEQVKAARAKAAAEAKKGRYSSSSSSSSSSSGRKETSRSESSGKSSGGGRRSSGHGRNHSHRASAKWTERMPPGVFHIAWVMVLVVTVIVVASCMRTGP